MKAVILAGGLGTRLRPFTQVIPKPLLPIGEKSVLQIQIESLRAYGFNEIFLATNYKSDYIRNFFGDGQDHGVKLHISKEEKPLGTVGPLTLLKDRLDEPFVVMNGDILTLLDFGKLYDFALNMNTCLTVAIKRHITPFSFGNIFFNNDYVTDVEEKKDIVSYILAGIYVLKPEVFNYIPDNTYYGVDNLIKDLLKKKQKITKYDIHEYWLDIGQVDDFEKAQNEFMQAYKNN
ncbi:MAG: NTP transferase domain-containing protein [Oligoflexia bacterium]|nr:NTP transferase domain-containing protein [Oligoflexia bacterium]